MRYNFILVTALLAFFPFIVKGNFEYKAGMIITHKNDTVYGHILDRGNTRNLKSIYFIKDKDSRRKRYYPEDIKAYRFTNGNYYRATEVFIKDDFKHVFVEVLLKGDLSLYYNPHDRVISYYIQKGENELISLPNPITDLNNTQRNSRIVYGKTYEYESELYKLILFSLFESSIDTQKKLVKLTYESKPLVKILTEYLEETCESKCISYKKKM
jgi:hypothetical protein